MAASFKVLTKNKKIYIPQVLVKEYSRKQSERSTNKVQKKSLCIITLFSRMSLFFSANIAIYKSWDPKIKSFLILIPSCKKTFHLKVIWLVNFYKLSPFDPYLT